MLAFVYVSLSPSAFQEYSSRFSLLGSGRFTLPHLTPEALIRVSSFI